MRVTRTSAHRTAGALLTSTVLLVGLGACTGGGSEEATDVEDQRLGAMEDFAEGDTFEATEPLTFDVLYRDHPNYPNDPDWLFYSELQERTGVTLETTLAPLSDWEQRRGLVIGAGDAPSLIPVTYPGAEVPFVSSGAILPVSAYTEYMPNYTAKVEEWDLAEELDGLRQEDGEYYVLPGITERLRPDYTFAMRMDVLDELGVEAPQDWDEVRAALEAIKAAHPDSYPLSDRFMGDALLNFAAPTFGTSAGWGFGQGVTWDAGAEEYVFTGAMDEYRDMVGYFAGLVEDGLMDPESFTQDDDTALQKLSNEQSFAITTNSQEIIRAQAALDAARGPGTRLAKIEVPTGPAGDVIGGSRLEGGLMISSDAVERDDFVAMLQFVDWLYYSDEGLELADWGVEGQTFERTADDGYELAPEVNFQGQNPQGPRNLQSDFGFFNGVYLHAQGSSWDLVTSHMPDEELAWQEEMTGKEQVPVPPPAPLGEIELEQAGLAQSALTDATAQATRQFILGQRPMSEWDDYVASLEATGVSTYLDLVNNAQQRYAEDNG